MPNATTSPYTRGDWGFAALVLAALVLDVAFRELVWPPVAVLFGCGLALAALVRRTHPLGAVVFAFGGFAVLELVAFAVGSEPVELSGGWVVLLLAYSLGRWGVGHDVAVGVAVLIAGVAVIVSVDFPGIAEAVAGVALVLMVVALGASVRYRNAARAQLIVQAKLQEREQLARELHDTVAHHVSAIAIQAQAGLFLARSSSLSGATDALEIIDREAARTLAEMRTMVSALRDREREPAEAVRRRIADLADLAAGGTDALRIDVALRGDLANLPPAVEGALYRVTQESITNAQRHARLATRVEVDVIGSATDVRLTVTDDGARVVPAAVRSGFGLIGMTERVALLGGTLSAGPNPDRGWSVRAVLPRRGAEA
ncbi:sensor histidine kinase [Catenuloplanes atrovinosus]|uniref:histidine kinase n=1 Tax=Catenuloplanes atrovinosus TaxID=137266 RepID=A0AAE3YP71_9ACTN|nr:histidine kinase [Catenuloplanes atrovinosus]MDR7277130.1 signal transduction histidine kinase [Catenuloplanes atrovinosus]